MEMFKKCLNPKVLIAIGIIAAGVLVFAPRLLLSALPLLLIAACPLSMMLMMGSMNKKEPDAHELLKQRYTKGEINDKEYEHMQKLISKEKG